MALRVSLYRGAEKVGTVTFRSLLLMKPDEQTSEPPDILDTKQLKALASALMRLPAIQSGTLDGFQWREE
jgi:hypothetical protein